MTSGRDEDRRARWGWAVAAVGGFFGAAGGGFLGGFLSAAYYEGRAVEPFEDLAGVVFYSAASIVLGAGLGSAGALRALRFPHPAVSGVLFALLLIVLVPASAGLGAVLLPVDLPLPTGVTLVALVSSSLAGVVSRGIVDELHVRGRLGSPPPSEPAGR